MTPKPGLQEWSLDTAQEPCADAQKEHTMLQTLALDHVQRGVPVGWLLATAHTVLKAETPELQ